MKHCTYNNIKMKQIHTVAKADQGDQKVVEHPVHLVERQLALPNVHRIDKEIYFDQNLYIFVYSINYTYVRY